MKRFKLILILVTLIFLTANGGWIDLGGGIEGKAPDITLINDDATGCKFIVTLNGFYLDSINIPEGIFSIIGLPAATHRMEKGNPELPKLDVNVLIPDFGEVSCIIENEDLVMFNVSPVIPSKGSLLRIDDPDTIPYTFNEIYTDGNWFPTDLKEISEPFIMCDYRGTSILLNVFKHNPVQGLLEVARKFEVVIEYENHQFVYKDSIAGSFLGIYKHFFLNFSESHYGTQRRMKMTIITEDNFYNEVMPLREWKMKKGILVENVAKISEVGRSVYCVKEFIYDQWLNHGVTYFLLVGDAQEIPSPYAPQAGVPADPIYILLTGDQYPDAFISRISGNDPTEIESQVDKILYYEKLPSTGEMNDWLKKGLIMASWEGEAYPPNYAADSTRKNHMGGLLFNKYSNVNKLYDHAANPDNIFSELDWPEGRGFVNFIGHGWFRGWQFSDPDPPHDFYTVLDEGAIPGIFNLNMPPFIISVACHVGKFDWEDCFAEAWLSGGHSLPERTGAVGFYGSSWYLDWVESEWADSVAIWSFTNNWFIDQHFPNTFGEILYLGGIQMINRFPRGYLNFDIWHIFGDATTQFRFGSQGELVVEHPSNGSPGSNFLVRVQAPEQAPPPRSNVIHPPCPKAVVCLWREDDYYNEYKLTDQNGYVNFILPGNLTSGSMFVTVTKYNKIPYEGSAMITVQEGGCSQTDEVINNYTNLSIFPSISGKTFRIKIPFYATSLDIYNSTGKLVKTVMANKREFIWKGVDEDGKLLPQGVYFVKASGNEKREIKKMLFIR
jgi:hypothetical protein